MAKSTPARQNMIANEPYSSTKTLKAIDIYHFDDGAAKVTFLKNVPVKDPTTGEITSFRKETPYEFVNGIPRNTPLEKITLRHVKIIEISE